MENVHFRCQTGNLSIRQSDEVSFKRNWKAADSMIGNSWNEFPMAGGLGKFLAGTFAIVSGGENNMNWIVLRT